MREIRLPEELVERMKKLLGEEESYEVLIGILDDKNATPEERARLLVGV